MTVTGLLMVLVGKRPYIIPIFILVLPRLAAWITCNHCITYDNGIVVHDRILLRPVIHDWTEDLDPAGRNGKWIRIQNFLSFIRSSTLQYTKGTCTYAMCTLYVNCRELWSEWINGINAVIFRTYCIVRNMLMHLQDCHTNASASDVNRVFLSVWGLGRIGWRIWNVQILFSRNGTVSGFSKFVNLGVEIWSKDHL